MSDMHSFRSALNGFHRGDVVQYLEYINNKHAAELSALNNELAFLRSKAEQPQGDCAQWEQQRSALEARLQEARERIAQLEARLKEQTSGSQEAELAAYRRAERTERLARERSEQVYHQVNGVLAEAASQVDGVASDVGAMADTVVEQLRQLQQAVSSSKQALKDAAATMYAIRPQSEE